MLILCIEDDEDHADLIRRIISKSPLTNYEFHVVSRIRDAIIFSAPPEKRPAVVIMDLDLKDCRGVTCFDQYHTVYPAVEVIIVSGSYTPEMAKELIEAGASAYISKDEFTLKNLKSNRLFLEIELALNKYKRKMDYPDAPGK